MCLFSTLSLMGYRLWPTKWCSQCSSSRFQSQVHHHYHHQNIHYVNYHEEEMKLAYVYLALDYCSWCEKEIMNWETNFYLFIPKLSVHIPTQFTRNGNKRHFKKLGQMIMVIYNLCFIPVILTYVSRTNKTINLLIKSSLNYN